MRDRSGRASGAGFRRSEGSDGSGGEALPPAWIGGPVGGSGTVVRRPAGVGDYRWIGDPASFAALLDELESCEVYALTPSSTASAPISPTSLSFSSPGRVGSPSSTLLRSISPRSRGSSTVRRWRYYMPPSRTSKSSNAACGTVPGRLFDTQVAAGFLGQVSPSLVKLVERILGVRLLKGDQLTDWTRRPLSAGQLAYAAGDVAHLLPLRDSISARLEDMGRLKWAEEEFAIVLSKDRSPTEPGEAWWRLPRSRQLRGSARGVAQSVAAWRDKRARQLDLPVRFILPDLALLSIAQHPARTREDLRRTRSLDGRHLNGGAAEELLEAISEGLEIAPSALRLPPAHEFEQPNRAVTTLATAYVAQRAADLDLDPAILATRADLVEFMQDPPQGRLAEGWRRDLVGDGLRRLSDGKAALSFDGHGALVLEERSFRSVDNEPLA